MRAYAYLTFIKLFVDIVNNRHCKKKGADLMIILFINIYIKLFYLTNQEIYKLSSSSVLFLCVRILYILMTPAVAAVLSITAVVIYKTIKLRWNSHTYTHTHRYTTQAIRKI